MNSNSRLILGIIAAGIAGVAIGMLLAPEKGTNVRKNIKGSMDDLGNKITDFINDGKDKIMGITNEFKSDVDAIKHDTQTAVQHTKKVVS